MNIVLLLKYLLLGLIQGLAEGLPISSSGHLLIFKHLIDLNVDFDTLAIITNFGSLVGIVIVFRNEWIRLIKHFFEYLFQKKEEAKADFKYCWLIVLGCIPAGLIGLVVKKLDLFESIDNNVKVVGISLIITSVMLYLVRTFKGSIKAKDMTWKEALKVGCFQILGIFPGISRSGSTLVGGLFSNLNRDTAFKYSFLLYVPMSVAATGLELFDLVGTKMETWTIIYYVLATILACLATMFTTKLFRRIVNQGKLIYFSAYCLIVGLLVLIFM